ncbi:MAG: NUDIX hydrolase [Patescibacteria group bacterium]|jgi:colanic acid biosynthesis protein WcaH
MALNKKEIERLSFLLKKIDSPNKGLPQPVFDALVNIVPFVACELVIVSKEGILLTWRDDKWFKGWHFPGGLLRFRESFEDRIKKVADKELGIKLNKHKFLFTINYIKGSRGHCISFIFLCSTSMAPVDGKFFRKMPKDIIKEHRELWYKLQKIKKYGIK